MSQAQLQEFRDAHKEALEWQKDPEAWFRALISSGILPQGDVIEDVSDPNMVELVEAETLDEVEKIILDL